MKKLLTTTALPILLMSLASVSYGGSKAIWPFNTPYMVARLNCTNSADMASAAANTPRERRNEFIAELDRRLGLELRDDPPYAAWTRIYYREMKRYVRMVWRNPDMTPAMAEEMVSESCAMGRQYLQEELEKTKP